MGSWVGFIVGLDVSVEGRKEYPSSAGVTLIPLCAIHASSTSPAL